MLGMNPTSSRAVEGAPETLQVDGPSLAEKVKELMHEGNVRHIVVKKADGETVLAIPVTAGVIGVALLPAVAAVGALAGLAGLVSGGVSPRRHAYPRHVTPACGLAPCDIFSPH